MSSNWNRRGAALAALVVALAAGGCVDKDKVIADLQKDLTNAKADSDRLTRKLGQANQRVEQLDRQVASLNKLPLDRWTLIPQPASLTIDGKSGLRSGAPQLSAVATTQSTAGPAVNVFARLYVIVADQDGFATRAAGAMKVSLFDLSSTPPRALGDYAFTPQEVARLRLYRSVLSREMFAFDLPLNAAPRDGRATVRVEFADLLTGRTFVAEASLTLLR